MTSTGVVVASLSVLNGCNAPSALDRLVEARRLSADMLVHFTKAADAGNRAVMADTDEASVAFAREAEQATEAVQHDEDALAPLLKSLGFRTKSRCSRRSGLNLPSTGR